MNKLFEYANSIWVRYSDYVITETPNGIKYLQPAPDAMPKPYDPVEEFENITLDAVNVGQLCMSQEATEGEKHEAISSPVDSVQFGRTSFPAVTFLQLRIFMGGKCGTSLRNFILE